MTGRRLAGAAFLSVIAGYALGLLARGGLG